MMALPTKEKYQPLLEKIKSSSEFKNSEKFQELLQYLVEETIKGSYVKEISIAIDVFNKDSSFDPNENPSIRVNVSKLRQKLRIYYLMEGKEETIRFELPKGKYVINFVKVRQRKDSKLLQNLWIFLSIVLALVLIGLFVSNQRNQYKPPAFWAQLFGMNDKPIMLLAGSFLHVDGEFANQFDLEEKQQIISNNSANYDKELKLTDRNYLIPGTLWGIQKIIPILEKSKVDYKLKLSSEVSYEDLKNYNIIYVGNIWDGWILNEYEEEWNVENWNPPQTIQFFEPDSVIFQREGANTSEDYKYQRHLGWLAFHKGPADNYILFFGGFNTEGNVGLTEYCTAPDFFDKIEKLNSEDPYPDLPYFDLILDIEGIKRNVGLIEHLYYRGTDF
jgi:hypothetical protein